MTRPFTTLELRAYSAAHVAYEIDMFFALAGMHSNPNLKMAVPTAEVGTVVQNALIESFGVHLRNVLDFLYIDQPQPTDIVAIDYCPAGALQAVRPAMSQKLAIARTRANKELAHLTTQRVSGNTWPFVALADEVRPLLQLFCTTANHGALAPEVKQAIDKDRTR